MCRPPGCRWCVAKRFPRNLPDSLRLLPFHHPSFASITIKAPSTLLLDWRRSRKQGVALPTTVSHWFVVLITAAMTPVCHGDLPPNILLIVADDLGFSDLGCYGGEIETPNLDTLAAEGVRMTQFYTTGRCCPSRASLLSGQYPHRVGLGHMTQDIGRPGYRGRIDDAAQTIAQRLRPAGYRSFLSGKWHLGTDDPTEHGFESFYGTLVSAKTYWDRDHFLSRPATDVPVQKDDAFYGTDALTDRAIDFIDHARQTPDKPWFLYLAYNAPHFPLHAKPRDIDKYADRYTRGWDEVRAARFASMKRLGIVSPTTKLSPRSGHFDWATDRPAPTPAWETLPMARQKDLARRMAIYAAMVDSMDQNIGRVFDGLRDRGELDNTVVIFTSDNGACAEWDPFGFDGESGPTNTLHTGEALTTMGGAGTYHSVGSGWAGASNTPWRMYKHFNHEGGIAVPFIIRHPQLSVAEQSTCDTPAHLIDVVPTLMDVAGVPTNDALPGESLLPIIRGEAFEPRPLFFEHEGNRAVRRGKWKLVALRGRPWQLYEMDRDRIETNDLAEKNPDLVERLAKEWDRWALENRVTPLPEDYEVEYLPTGGEPPESAGHMPVKDFVVSPVQKLADGFRFTEGPAWAGDGIWYFSDLPSRTLHRLDGSMVMPVREGPGMSNGLAVAASGDLIFCEVGERRVVRRNVDGKEAVLADACDGRPLGFPNDLWISPRGDVYFTMPRIKKHQQKKVSGDVLAATVCRIDGQDGSVEQVGFGMKSSNGIVGSHDGKTLYVADPGSQSCWRYSIDEHGRLFDQRLAAPQGSDGLAVDIEGNLFTTSKQGINVYSPNEKLLVQIPLPESPANFCFGGDDGRDLLVTARTSIYKMRMAVPGRGKARHP